MEIQATKAMDKHHKAILAMDKQLILHMDRTMAVTPVMDKANQVIHSPTGVMRTKSRAHMASNRIITRDNSTRNHQEATVEEQPSYDQSNYSQQDSYDQQSGYDQHQGSYDEQSNYNQQHDSYNQNQQSYHSQRENYSHHTQGKLQ